MTRQPRRRPPTHRPRPARRHPRRRHRAGGDRRGAQGPRGGRPGRVKFEQTRYDLGAERYLATGEVLPDSVLDEIRGARRDPARRGRRQARRPEPAARHPRARAAAAAALRARPLRQPAPVRGSSPGVASPLRRPAARSTSWSSARAPRAPTPATAARSGSAPRTRSPPRSRVNTAYGVERVVRDAFARAQRRPRKKLTLVHKTNVLVNAGAVWWRLVEEVGAGVPRGRPSTTCTSTRRRSS